MSKVVNRLIVFVLIGVVASGVALAKNTRKEVTFLQPIWVNGALVKKGTYDVVFNDQTNELTVVKGREVVARASAQLGPKDSDRSDYVTREDDGDPGKTTLLSVTLKSGKATLVNDGNGNAAQ